MANFLSQVSWYPCENRNQECQQTPKKRSALGRGLESRCSLRVLLRRSGRDCYGCRCRCRAGSPRRASRLEIAVDQIDRNPFQTRTHFDEEKLNELAKSIAASGVVQPHRRAQGRAVLAQRALRADHRRAPLAGLEACRQGDGAGDCARGFERAGRWEMTIVENLQRADLNPMEQAHAFARLSREFHLTQGADGRAHRHGPRDDRELPAPS